MKKTEITENIKETIQKSITVPDKLQSASEVRWKRETLKTLAK